MVFGVLCNRAISLMLSQNRIYTFALSCMISHNYVYAILQLFIIILFIQSQNYFCSGRITFYAKIKCAKFVLLLKLINCPIKTVQKYLKFNEDNAFEITMNRVFFQTLKHFGHFIIIILGTMHIQGLWLIVFNATFNNISVISWRSVSLVEETGVPGERQGGTSRNLLTNFITFCCIEYTSTERDSNSQR